LRPVFLFRSPVTSEFLADQAQEGVEVSADEDECEHSEHGDEGEDESIFRETLSFLAMKD
jgi:hypothetical protein